jgi:SAM-dependent methyltransferase
MFSKIENAIKINKGGFRQKFLSVVSFAVQRGLGRDRVVLGRPYYNLEELRGRPRSVEYFWVTRELLREDKRILEIGTSRSYYSEYLAQLGYEVWGMDQRPWKCRNVKLLQADARTAELPEQYFDAIISVSVLEHVGLRHDGCQTIVEDAAGPCRLVKNVAPSLRRGGRMLFTFPYGSGRVTHEEMQWIFDRNRLDELVTASGLKITAADFFLNNYPHGLMLGDRETMEQTNHFGDFGQYAIACVCLQK